MTTEGAYRILQLAVNAIFEIDLECRTLLNGIEHGLVNVKAEFQEQAKQQTGKKLTEELLIAWRLQQKLTGLGHSVRRECPYPEERRRKCDLVICDRDGIQLWLELKLAWKAWFECKRGAAPPNPKYLCYLQDNCGSHSFRQDFGKLELAPISDKDYRAVCLIGFDKLNEEMDDEVSAIVQKAIVGKPRWTVGPERHWSDRRCEQFRVNVWNWLLLPESSGGSEAEFEKPIVADSYN